MHTGVDDYLHNLEQWKAEMERLRAILLGCGLSETLKWGKPCYTFEGANIAILQGFRETCALMFFKGVLLEDPDGILEKPGKHSRFARRVPLTGVGEIEELAPVLEAYVREAVEAEREGREVETDGTPDLPVPDEFRAELESNPALKTAFASLTPGRRRGYLLYFNGAKRSAARASRVARCTERILQGKGLRDR